MYFLTKCRMILVKSKKRIIFTHHKKTDADLPEVKVLYGWIVQVILRGRSHTLVS